MDAHTDAALRTLENLGQLIFFDDEKDFGKFSSPRHPSPIHHWQLGLAMRGGAALMRTLVELAEAADLMGDPARPSMAGIVEEIHRLLREAP